MCRQLYYLDHLWLQMMLKAGGEGRPTVFLFSDNQIKDESFVEDINVILNTGDVPNLYAADEKADIIEKMQVVARQTVSCLPFSANVCTEVHTYIHMYIRTYVHVYLHTVYTGIFCVCTSCLLYTMHG